MSPRVRALALPLAIALLGCAKYPTALYVEISAASPGVVPQFDRVHVRVLDATGTSVYHEVDVTASSFPVTVAVTYGDHRTVIVEAAIGAMGGMGMGGMQAPVLVGRAIGTFVDDQVLNLPLALWSGCRSTMVGMTRLPCPAGVATCDPPLSLCAPTETCTMAGTCTPIPRRTLEQRTY